MVNHLLAWLGEPSRNELIILGAALVALLVWGLLFAGYLVREGRRS